MITIVTTVPYVLMLLWCTGLSYGQNHRPAPKTGGGSKLYPREVKNLPKFTRYDYLRSPRDPFLDKSVKTTIVGDYKANVLDKMVLVSWLDDAGKIVIFVQNTETNDVQRVTSEPNKSHFRWSRLPQPGPEVVQGGHLERKRKRTGEIPDNVARSESEDRNDDSAGGTH